MPNRRASLRLIFASSSRESSGGGGGGGGPDYSEPASPVSQTSASSSRPVSSTSSSATTTGSAAARRNTGNSTSTSTAMLTSPFRRMSLKRRSWFLDMSSGGTADDEEASEPTTTASSLGSRSSVNLNNNTAVAQARAIIEHRDRRQELINHLIAVDSDYIEKIRFCSCVREFERTPAKSAEREEKGRKIVSLFISHEARFPVQGVPQAVVTKLQAGAYGELPRVSATVLTELTTHRDFMIAVNAVQAAAVAAAAAATAATA